jgi:thiosulfate/3-mercaptopyruvate sulfurtransferase
MRALGVRNSSTVVVYDAVGIYSSARAWWMLRAMGFDRVGVLDGGLPAWIAAGRPCQPRPSGTPPLGDFVAKPRQGTIINRDAVLAALTDDAAVVLDARSTARFTGRSEEPRPGLRRGHLPGSVNLPFGDLQIDGHLRPVDELRGILSDLVGQRTRLIFSCGSGVTACILALGADLAGYRELAVYDGSWSDWGRPSALPVARTEPEAANP